MKYVPSVNNDSLKGGLIASVGLHSLMFFFVFFGLPRLIPPLPAHHGPIPFDIVTIGEITNTRIGPNSDVPSGGSPPPPAPAPAPAPTAPEPSAPVTPPKAETTPEKDAKAEDVIGLKAPKPTAKPKPPPAKPAPQQDLLGSVLKNVAKIKPAQRSDVVDPKAKPDDKAVPQAATVPGAGNGAGTGEGAGSGMGGPSFSDRLTISEEDALRRQIERCWNPPVGARDAQNLVVEIIIDVNPDRTVLDTEVVDKLRYASDPFFRAAVDAAVRAVRNPKCNPLELVPENYEQWKRINFTFDPRDML